jgi:hypothetical protein
MPVVSRAMPLLVGMLAAIFLAASAAKAGRWASTVDWFAVLGFPLPIQLARAAVVSEVAIVVALAHKPSTGAMLAVPVARPGQPRARPRPPVRDWLRLLRRDQRVRSNCACA